MKNQNDLIFSIVGFVVLLIVVGVCIGTRPQPVVPTPPPVVNTATPTYPQGVAPVMANSLPGASSSGGAGGGGAVAMGAGGAATMGGGRASAGLAGASPSGGGSMPAPGQPVLGR